MVDWFHWWILTLSSQLPIVKVFSSWNLDWKTSSSCSLWLVIIIGNLLALPNVCTVSFDPVFLSVNIGSCTFFLSVFT